MHNDLPRVFFDIETRSKADLRKVGGWKYGIDPTTEIICAAWVEQDGRTTVWTPEQLPGYPSDHRMIYGDSVETISIIQDLAENKVWVAHNGEAFDRIVWENQTDFPRPFAWIDTLMYARVCGLPGSLDAIAKRLLGLKKDKAGRSAMLSFSKPDKNGNYKPLTLGALMPIIEYCVEDVYLMRDCYEYLEAAEGFEPDVRAVDVAINRRGFMIDRKRTNKLLKLALEARERAIARVKPLGLTLRDLRSPRALVAWYKVNGFPWINNVQANTIRGLPGDGGLVADARAQVARTSFGKFEYMLRAMDDEDRLHYQVAYGAAHTLRWGGRGVQPHNLPRGVLKPHEVNEILKNLTLDHIEEWARDKQVPVGDIFASLIRCCIIAPPGKLLALHDYSSVEVIGVSWVAKDRVALAAHERQVDPYIAFAMQALGLKIDKKHPMRQAMKPVVLGCGYQLGEERLKGYAAGMGVNLDDSGKTAKELVELYRDTYPMIAGERFEFEDRETGEIISGRKGGLWKKLEEAAIQACKGRKTRAARCRFERHGKNLVVWLPNGCPQLYRGVFLKKVMTPWGQRKEQLFYKSPKGTIEDMYGGKWIENLVQRICRDLLAAALVRLEAAGYRTVLHVHDEAIIEVEHPDECERIQEIMEYRVGWAEDFPLHAAGITSPHYLKD